MLINIPGINCQVSTCSLLATIATFGKDAKKAVVKGALDCGGAMALYYTEEQIAVVQRELPKLPGVTQEMLDEVKSIKPGPFIQLFDEFFIGMTDEEKLAILFHEQAHIVNGDIFRKAPEGFTGIYFIEDVEIELKADAYAVSKLGKKVVRSAMRKIYKNNWRTMNMLIKMKGKKPMLWRDFLAHLERHPGYNLRNEALAA